MKGKILAICTQEPEYARGLSEYILGRRELLFQVMVFLDLEKLRQFINEHRVDLLLLDDIYADTETMDVKQVFMLCDDRNYKETDCYHPIYKYQSGEKIIAEILSCCAEEEGSETILRIQKADVEVIGVYSPIHRIGKTQYALQLAKEFAKKGNTLYLNLEAYAGRQEGEEETGGLTEILYYLRQGCKNMGIRLETLVKHINFGFATLYSNELVYVGVHFYTDVTTCRYAHQSQLHILPRPKCRAEVMIHIGCVSDIKNKRFRAVVADLGMLTQIAISHNDTSYHSVSISICVFHSFGYNVSCHLPYDTHRGRYP